MKDWDPGEAEAPAPGHTALGGGRGLPGFWMLEVWSPGGAGASSSFLSESTGKRPGSDRLPKTHSGASALRVVCYNLHLVDELCVSH